MKKIITLLVLVLILSSCGSTKVISEEVTDKRFTASYSEVQTNYVYKYDFWDGDFKLLPETKTVNHPDTWEFHIVTTYDTGGSSARWEKVTAEEYELISIGDSWEG